jgi:hypothetical protein
MNLYLKKTLILKLGVINGALTKAFFKELHYRLLFIT